MYPVRRWSESDPHPVLAEVLRQRELVAPTAIHAADSAALSQVVLELEDTADEVPSALAEDPQRLLDRIDWAPRHGCG